MKVACILKGGSDYTIEANGCVYHFEMHPYCGLTVLTKRGKIADNQPPPKSPFWEATRLWDKQGRRVGEDGLCIWEPEVEPPLNLKHLGGRHYLVVANRDEEGAKI